MEKCDENRHLYIKVTEFKSVASNRYNLRKFSLCRFYHFNKYSVFLIYLSFFSKEIFFSKQCPNIMSKGEMVIHIWKTRLQLCHAPVSAGNTRYIGALTSNREAVIFSLHIQNVVKHLFTYSILTWDSKEPLSSSVRVIILCLNKPPHSGCNLSLSFLLSQQSNKK